MGKIIWYLAVALLIAVFFGDRSIWSLTQSELHKRKENTYGNPENL